MAAQEVLRVRGERFPHLRLVLVLPYVGQESQWSQRDAAVYRALLRQADEVVYTAKAYTRGCLFLRNRYLVDHSAHCVCYLQRDTGGTAYTVRYARERGLVIHDLTQGWKKEKPL